MGGDINLCGRIRLTMKKIVIANWKMNPEFTLKAKVLFDAMKKISKRFPNVSLVVAPPYIYISKLVSKRKNLLLGAQNVFFESRGAFTGEISATMLSSFAVKFVIIGHSERRALGESDSEISKKIKASLRSSLTPILCIGEKEHDHHGDYLAFLRDQIRHSLQGIQRKDISKIVIAYEPLWAIGKTAKDAVSPRILHETVIYIRKVFSEIYGRQTSESIKIIYGGSVEAENANELVREGRVDGFLVGHASLDSREFSHIVEAVAKK